MHRHRWDRVADEPDSGGLDFEPARRLEVGLGIGLPFPLVARVEGRVEELSEADAAGHDADAFGYIAEAELAGIVSENIPRLSQGSHKVKVKTAVGVTDDWDDDVKIRVKR